MAQPKKTKKLKLAVVISMLTLLGLLLVALIGGGIVALSLYNQMTYEDLEGETLDQDFMEATLALQNGVPLDTILKDPYYRFTLQDIEDLKTQYNDWLLSLDGTNTSGSNNTLELEKDPPPDEPLPEEAAKLINILCLGTDSRSGSARGRADVMMMITVNTEDKTITITSFLRDMYLKISGTEQYNKLNAAYLFGGVTGTQNTLSDYFGLEFDNYARVDFAAFQKVIDTLGGVEVELSPKEIKNLSKEYDWDKGDPFDPEKHRVEGKENVYLLDGTYALRLCRDRYANDDGQGDGDFGRTSRQRRVLAAAIEKAQSMSFGQLMELIPVVLPMVTTDLTVTDCVNLLASVGTSYSSYKIQTCRVPASGTYSYGQVNGSSVLSVDFEKNKKMLHSLIFGD